MSKQTKKDRNGGANKSVGNKHGNVAMGKEVA